MGMSIDIHVFDNKKLTEALKTKKNGELIISAMKDFGIVRNDLFILQSSDYWDDYSPWSQFLKLIRCLSDVDDDYKFLDSFQIDWVYDGKNATDWYYEKYKKELPDDPDEED